jgi:hypothetical protein
MPQPTSTAKRRPIARPAGARQLTPKQCSSTIDAMAFIEIAMRGIIKGYAATPTIAAANFKTLPAVLGPDRRTLSRVRSYWLAAGYPATFPTVRDVDAMIGAADRMLAAAKQDDPTHLPEIYLDYNSALDQYTFDASNSLCPE